MGRRFYSNRLTVEDCKMISIFSLNKSKYLDGSTYFGAVTWSRFGRKTFRVDLQISMTPGKEWINFQHQYSCSLTSLTLNAEYPVKLLSTPCFFGGRRYWFACPAPKNDNACCRRVGVLYLEPGDKCFRCRKCCDLTYSSCQDSHRFDAIYQAMGGLSSKELKHAFKKYEIPL